VNSSELHLDLDSILKPGSFMGSQILNQPSGNRLDDEMSLELKSDLKNIT
jgi:hypothetical protein